jgi:NTP pyrophosphatase (non-canonical NTP hydrolase)
MKSDPDYKDHLIRVANHFANNPETQLIKLMEECGEVAAAWIGATGTNPRKGFSHNIGDVGDELADVVATALVAMVMLGFDPFELITRQQEKAEGRLLDAPAHVSGRTAQTFEA